MKLQFEQARPQDAEAIFSLCRDLVTQYEDPQQVDIPRALAWCRRKIDKCIHEYTRVLWEGQVAGYYHFTPCGDGMELDDLYILPPFRGRGFGSAVVEKCCRETKEPICLCVFAQNTGAIALYERFGFTVTQSIGTTRLLMHREVL